jgi:hypothetical protein
MAQHAGKLYLLKSCTALFTTRSRHRGCLGSGPLWLPSLPRQSVLISMVPYPAMGVFADRLGHKCRSILNGIWGLRHATISCTCIASICLHKSDITQVSVINEWQMFHANKEKYYHTLDTRPKQLFSLSHLRARNESFGPSNEPLPYSVHKQALDMDSSPSHQCYQQRFRGGRTWEQQICLKEVTWLGTE